jgi:hypothetical protein
MLYQRQQPAAALLGLRNKWLAWQVDECVFVFGRRLEGLLHACHDDVERDMVLHRELRIERAPKKMNLAARAALGGTTIEVIG